MAQFASYRDMHPVAQQLVAKLFDALAQEADDLAAMDRSKMSLVERGRWSSQVLRLLKALQKDYPEASENTKEGRLALHRLKTPEELAAEEAEFDALLGLPPQPPRTSFNGVHKPEPPTAERFQASQERERLEPQPSADERPISNGTPVADAPSSLRWADAPMEFDRDAEIAEILRRVNGNGTIPPRGPSG